MMNPVLVELLEHWERLRAGRIAPMRSEIDPRAIENVLEHAFILERPASGVARFRIAGMQLADLMGMEVRGMPAETIINAEDRPQFQAILNGLFQDPEIIQLDLATAQPGQTGIRAEMLLLPMKNDQGEISRVLGCLVSQGAIFAPPYRFHIRSHKITRIVGQADPGVAETPEQSVIDTRPIAGFAETPAVFKPAPVTPKPDDLTARPSYLRLVSSDEGCGSA